MRWQRTAVCGGCGSVSAAPAPSFGAIALVACAECGLIRLRERVVEEDLHMLYAEAYGAAAGNLDEQLANPTFAFRRGRLERFAEGAQRSIFEVGCGDGNFLAFLRRAGWAVSGSELDASARQAVLERHSIGVVPGDVTAPGCEHRTSPVVAAYHVLEHVYHPRRWLESVHGMLAVDGLLHLQVPNYASLTRRIAGRDWASIVYPQHVQFFTPALLEALLRRTGFEVLSTTTWDPWHGPGTVAISLAGRIRRLRGSSSDQEPAIVSGAPAAAATGGRRSGRAAHSARAVFAGACAALARAEAAIGRGAVVDVIARRVGARNGPGGGGGAGERV